MAGPDCGAMRSEVCIMSDPAVNIEPEIVNSEFVGSGIAVEQTQQFQSHVGHISRHSGVFFAGTIFTAAFGYAFKVYLAHFLGAEALGLYALGVTLIGFFGIFNSLGLAQSAVRFVAVYLAGGKFKELHALLWRGATLVLIANFLLAVVLLIFGSSFVIHFYHSPALAKILPFFALLMLVSALNNFYGKVLAGYRDLKLRTLIVNFIGSPLTMLMAVLLISAGMGLRGYLLSQILSAVFVSFLLLVAVRHFTPPAARFSSHFGSFPEWEVWSFSASMLGITFLEFAMSQADKVFLGYFRSAREVGIYSVAMAVVVYVALVLTSINQIFAPTIADLHTRGDHALLSRLFQSLTKWALGLTMPLAIVIIVLSRPLMRTFGVDFEAGWPILIIGTLGQLVNCGVGSVGYLLLMSGNQKRLMKVEIAMGIVMVVLSAALVPVWGMMGSAIAAAIVNVGTNAWNLLEVRRALGLSPYNRSYFGLLPPTIAVFSMTLVLKRYSFVFHRDWLTIGVALAMAYALFALMIFIKGLNADDRLIASAIWLRVRAAFVKGRAEVSA
jgi:O-antigen/teichoic acid export membrane protein